MKVKKYAAPTMPEVMRQIRQELGSEAVILNSRKVKHSGFLGIKKKSGVEVVAALDPKPLKENKQDIKQTISHAAPLEKEKSPNSTEQVLNELHVLKKMIHQSATEKNKYPAEYQFMYLHLLEQEAEEAVAKKLLDQVIAYHEAENIKPTHERIQQDVKRDIVNQLKDLPCQPISRDQRIVHFVGPTGVGKTTTIAKIAANRILKKGKRIAFITTDTYRIAAVEQLKTYAKILQVPLEVAYTKEDYVNAVKNFAEYDHILVDTAGRNFREHEYINDLMASVDADLPISMYLVLSLTAKARDTLDIYEQFRHLPIKQTILTKLDETRQYGSMLNLTLGKQVGVAYLTNGQDVPDDLLEAAPERIANYFIGGNHHA